MSYTRGFTIPHHHLTFIMGMPFINMDPCFKRYSHGHIGLLVMFLVSTLWSYWFAGYVLSIHFLASFSLHSPLFIRNINEPSSVSGFVSIETMHCSIVEIFMVKKRWSYMYVWRQHFGGLNFCISVLPQKHVSWHRNSSWITALCEDNSPVISNA